MNIPKIAIWAGSIAGLIMAFGIATHFFSKEAPTIHQHSVAIALAELNQQAPDMIDENTRFDSTAAISEKQVAFNYTLINEHATQIDAMGRVELEDRVIQQTCNEQDKNLLSHNIKMVFRFKNADAILLDEFFIKPHTCVYDAKQKKFLLNPDAY
jgi:hypothetical protein